MMTDYFIKHCSFLLRDRKKLNTSSLIWKRCLPSPCLILSSWRLFSNYDAHVISSSDTLSLDKSRCFLNASWSNWTWNNALPCFRIFSVFSIITLEPINWSNKTVNDKQEELCLDILSHKTEIKNLWRWQIQNESSHHTSTRP
jgi:hypothetical protein